MPGRLAGTVASEAAPARPSASHPGRGLPLTSSFSSTSRSARPALHVRPRCPRAWPSPAAQPLPLPPFSLRPCSWPQGRGSLRSPAPRAGPDTPARRGTSPDGSLFRPRVLRASRPLCRMRSRTHSIHSVNSPPTPQSPDHVSLLPGSRP